MGPPTRYRILLAVLFGAAGFGVNFLDIQLLPGTPFTVSILAGLYFPLVIALAWGWRFGLLAALAGGGQAMWWLWREDGWGVFYAVPVFTLWIVWHGGWAEYRRADGRHARLATPFVVEIPFRLVVEGGFYTVFPWLVSHNPPPWNPAIAWNHVSLGWIHTVAVKHTLTAYLLLLAAYVTLSIKPVRRFFGMRPLPAERDTTAIWAGAAFLGGLLWISGALVDCLFLHPSRTFLEAIFFDVPPQVTLLRTMSVLVLLLAAAVVAHINRQRVGLRQRMAHINRVLAAIRNVNQLITHEKSRKRLLEESCRLLVETRGYYNAWIALVEDGRPVEPVYQAGFNGGFQPMAAQLHDGNVPACALATLAAGGVRVVEDPAAACPDCPLSSAYQGRAAMTLRLDHDERIYGWLSVSVPRDMVADPEEQGLLVEVGGDISHALWTIENEARRRSVERRHAALLENLSEAVIATDLDGTIVVFNPGAERLFACGAEDALGGPIQRFCPADRQDEQARLLETVRDRGVARNIETERQAADGRRFPVEITLDLSLDDDDRAAGYSAILRDITERKQLESRLRQLQKMEAIGTLAGGIAHDFNNVLFPIMGMAEMLVEDLPPDSPQREYAAEILQAARRAGDLVKQVLSFSRKSDHTPIPMRLPPVLKEVVKLSRATIPAYIEIRQEIDPACGLVHADPTQVHQIAMNLITNAYHAFGQTDGRITVGLERTELSAGDCRGTSLAPGPHAVMTVSDNGCGIDPSVLDRIFEPYFTTKAEGKGTGLGLSVVYGIVKQYRGDIRVTSAAGSGSTFRVYLPLIKGAPAERTKPDTPELPTGSERILLVDDEQPILRMVAQMLERLGYRVTACDGGDAALAMLRSRPEDVDLLVTDMNMPQMAGDRLARECLAVNPGLPVILCTGFSERINPETAAAIGIKGFLMKPVVKSDMARMVRAVIDGTRTQTAEP